MDGLQAFHASSIGFFRELAQKLPDARCWEENGLIIGLTGWNLSAFNSAIVLDENNLSAAALDHLSSVFAETGLPFSILVFSHEQVPACDAVLKDNGYAVLFNDPILACEGPLTIPAKESVNARVHIEPVTITENYRHFREVVTEAFQMPNTFSAEMFDQLLRLPSSRPMLAWLNGQPVGAGMLIYSEGVAAIFNVATLEPWRRQGIGTEMMRALHTRALNDGYPGTVLAALPDGQALYERLGYRAHGYQISYSIVEQLLKYSGTMPG